MGVGRRIGQEGLCATVYWNGTDVTADERGHWPRQARFIGVPVNICFVRFTAPQTKSHSTTP
jgi:hypothetical protein